MAKAKETVTTPAGVNALATDPSFIASIATHRAVSAEFEKQMADKERQEALHRHQPLLGPAEEDYESPELIAAARAPRGFRRSGVALGPEKTIIPAGTFKTRAAFDAFMSDPNIIAVEGAGTSKALRGNATDAVAPGAMAPIRSTSTLGGSTENATPEMLKAAGEGTLLGHPSVGAGAARPAVPIAPVGVMSDGAAEIEKVKMERESRATKKTNDE